MFRCENELALPTDVVAAGVAEHVDVVVPSAAELAVGKDPERDLNDLAAERDVAEAGERLVVAAGSITSVRRRALSRQRRRFG